MIIGHLPAAYLAFKSFAPRKLARSVFIAGLIGGVAPDLDMLWFHFVDGKQHHHHDYLTHRPILWIGLLLLFLLLRTTHRHQTSAMGVAFALGALLHLSLDSIAGKIAWAWPISDHAVPLVVVQPTHSHWLLSFMTHWTFQLEVVLTLLAIFVFWRSQRSKPS